MRTICVAGASSGAGKTTLACALLRNLSGWAALKVTRCHAPGACPHEKACGVCSTLDRPCRLTEMTAANDLPGKDTDRLRRAGASRVLWLVTRPEALERGLRTALSRLKGAPGVVVEGNSAAPCLRADLVVMVRRPGDAGLSPSALTAMSCAHEVLVLDEKTTPAELEATCRRILRPVLARAKREAAVGGGPA